MNFSVNKDGAFIEGLSSGFVRSRNNVIHSAFAGCRAMCNQNMHISGLLTARAVAHASKSQFCEHCFGRGYTATAIEAAKKAIGEL